VGHGTNATNTNQHNVARKVTRMCLAISACFTVTSLPLQINVYLLNSGNRVVAANTLNYMKLVAQFDACLHPVIYGFMWRPFRNALIQVFRRFVACKKFWPYCFCSSHQQWSPSTFVILIMLPVPR
jgi:hypothetical protein